MNYLVCEEYRFTSTVACFLFLSPSVLLDLGILRLSVLALACLGLSVLGLARLRLTVLGLARLRLSVLSLV